VSSSSSQKHVQMSRNSSLTNRQAPASSKGPVVIPTLMSVSSSESFTKLMRLPQLYPSTIVFQTSSVHWSHPHRTGAKLDEDVGESVGVNVDGDVGESVGVNVGGDVGESVGVNVGGDVGRSEGNRVGDKEGTPIGPGVSSLLSSSPQ
jgi:hypothetical protein